jgi:uncharacterized protein YbjT (DUF2867 family)
MANDMKKTRILITGATGYIGRRLKKKLMADPELQIRIFVRNAAKVEVKTREQVEVVEGDTFDKEKLARALENIDVAFYLIHSMGADKDFRALTGGVPRISGTPALEPVSKRSSTSGGSG